MKRYIYILIITLLLIKINILFSEPCNDYIQETYGQNYYGFTVPDGSGCVYWSELNCSGFCVDGICGTHIYWECYNCSDTINACLVNFLQHKSFVRQGFEELVFGECGASLSHASDYGGYNGYIYGATVNHVEGQIYSSVFMLACSSQQFFPYNPDQDGDGINDDCDTEPNNENCPNSACYSPQNYYCGDYQLTIYLDNNHICKNLYSTNAPIQFTGEGQYFEDDFFTYCQQQGLQVTMEFNVGSNCLNWSQLNPNCQSTNNFQLIDNNTNLITTGENVNFTNIDDNNSYLENATTTNIYNKVSDINKNINIHLNELKKMLAQKLTNIDNKLTITNRKLSEINNSIQQGNNKLESINNNINESNNKLEDIKTKLDEIKNKQIQAGNLEDINNIENPEYNTDIEIPEEDNIQDKIINKIENSSIKDFFENKIHINLDNPECQIPINIDIFGHSKTSEINFCQFQSTFNTIGNILIGLSYLLIIYIVFI